MAWTASTAPREPMSIDNVYAVRQAADFVCLQGSPGGISAFGVNGRALIRS
jgi:hypothetical protein